MNPKPNLREKYAFVVFDSAFYSPAVQRRRIIRNQYIHDHSSSALALTKNGMSEHFKVATNKLGTKAAAEIENYKEEEERVCFNCFWPPLT